MVPSSSTSKLQESSLNTKVPKLDKSPEGDTSDTETMDCEESFL